MSDPLREKVNRLMQSLAGERADRVAESTLHREVIQRIKRAHLDLGAADASRLGLHMSDWVSDAAFVLALHLFPEEFSDAEIREGVGQFLCHAPNHIRAACRITGQYVWEDFPDDDTSLWDDER
ncbi:MAG: hypothetical protein IPK26_11225 [Planctomycetes bacterium]|nr:hypothetical protein [Planctomycetota bacterium]